MRKSRGLFAILAGVAVGLITAALLVSQSSTSRARAAQRVLRVTERDFRIRAPHRAAAGRVVLQVTNRGPDTHEFIVVRATSARLPLRPDGLTVDEDGLRSVTAGALDGIMPGHSHALRLRLTPGRYVLFCNMAGHYLSGMHAEIVVP